MKRVLRNGLMFCACPALALVIGCGQPNPGPQDMKDMKPPARPATLDSLQPFIGTWEGSGECVMGGESHKLHGTSTAEWDCDKWVMVEKGNHSMEGMGDAGDMSMLAVWTWNDKANHFDMHFFSNMGENSVGTAKFDPATQTWHMTGSGTNPMTGKSTVGEGTCKMVNNDTMQWTWKEWDNSMKMGQPMMSMAGESHKKM